MQKTIFLILVALLSFSCNNNVQKESFVSEFLNENNLPEQNFTINPSVENKIKTKQGIEFTIPANAFKTNEPNVEIIIKEALTINDIIKAKLTTQTKDGLLSSDGMFYFGTKQNIALVKNVDVKLPTNNYNTNMQLYKGNKQNDAIVWESPKAIMQKADLPNGEALFTKNCASCHALDKKLTGTPLAHVEERFSNRKNLVEYIKNNQKFMAWHYYKFDSTASLLSNDEIEQKLDDVAYARYVYCVFGKSAMNVFEGVLNDQEINAILNYVKQESKKYPNTIYANGDYEKCIKVQKELELLSIQLSDLKQKNPPKQMVDVKNMHPTSDTIGDIPKVEIEKYEAQNYVFSIEATGWYNIDELLNKENTVMSNLTVEPNPDTLKRKEVFLVIPSYKIFAQGGLINKTQYSFLDANSGNLSLPQGVVAYAIVFGESSNQLYFGINEFITTANQNIPIVVNITSKETIEKTINNLKLNRLNLKIEENKVPKEIDSLNILISKKVSELSSGNCSCLNGFFK
ncbi:MAG: c-type cytochrome [Chitinophagaceae bacterium]